MAEAIPPSYSTSDLVPPPSYSAGPQANEQRVAYTPRTGYESESRQGHYTVRWSQATLILKDQEDGVPLPTYSRGGEVSGELDLSNTTKVLRVTLEVSIRAVQLPYLSCIDSSLDTWTSL